MNMDRLAFVFSGQADLEPGIRELIEDSPEAMHVIAACDRIRPDTSVQIFFGNESEFRQPSIAQPCLYAMELAAAAALREHGITASAAAGYSIGSP